MSINLSGLHLSSDLNGKAMSEPLAFPMSHCCCTIYYIVSKSSVFANVALRSITMYLLLLGPQIFIQGAILDRAIAGAGAVLFSLFIIFDTHMIMHKVSPEEYIHASVNLYLDIINLFLHILRLLGERKNWVVDEFRRRRVDLLWASTLLKVSLKLSMWSKVLVDWLCLQKEIFESFFFQRSFLPRNSNDDWYFVSTKIIINGIMRRIYCLTFHVVYERLCTEYSRPQGLHKYAESA